MTPQDFDDFVDVVNNEINDVDLTLRRSRDERDGRTVIVLVNTKDDEIAQVATNYTTNEIAYFKQLVRRVSRGSSTTHPAFFYSIARDDCTIR